MSAIDRVKRTVRRAFVKVKSFFKGLFRHAEMTTVLVTSAVGMNAMIGELPYMYQLPMWIEAPLVIPVLSATAITLLLKSAEKRRARRGLTVAA